MRRVALDKKDKRIKDFIQSLSKDVDSSILELQGQPVVKVVPLRKDAVDEAKLKAAIRKRRDESRRLNHEWQAADRESFKGQRSRT